MTNFSDFQYEPVPMAGEETMGDKWNAGVTDGELWHQMELVLDSGLLYPQVVMQQRYSESLCARRLNNFDSKKSH